MQRLSIRALEYQGVMYGWLPIGVRKKATAKSPDALFRSR